MEGQIEFTVSLVCIALFVVAILSFAVGFANDNDAAVNLADDSEMTSLRSGTSADASEFNKDSESTYKSIIDTTIEPGSDVIQSSGPFAITPTNVIGITKNVISVGYKKIFGSGSGFSVFLVTFLGLLVFIIALLIWKTWKGSP